MLETLKKITNSKWYFLSFALLFSYWSYSHEGALALFFGIMATIDWLFFFAKLFKKKIEAYVDVKLNISNEKKEENI